MSRGKWNTRPIEDGLRAELEEMRAERDEYQDAQIKLMEAVALAELQREQIAAERDKWRDQANEYLETYNKILREDLPNDEQHCTCVPVLRAELAGIRAERDALKNSFEKSLKVIAEENNRMAEHLQEIYEAQVMVMDEECPTDEKHCACVPILRNEINRLEADVQTANNITEIVAKREKEIRVERDHYNVALEEMLDGENWIKDRHDVMYWRGKTETYEKARRVARGER